MKRLAMALVMTVLPLSGCSAVIDAIDAPRELLTTTYHRFTTNIGYKGRVYRASYSFSCYDQRGLSALNFEFVTRKYMKPFLGWVPINLPNDEILYVRTPSCFMFTDEKKESKYKYEKNGPRLMYSNNDINQKFQQIREKYARIEYVNGDKRPKSSHKVNVKEEQGFKHLSTKIETLAAKPDDYGQAIGIALE